MARRKVNHTQKSSTNSRHLTRRQRQQLEREEFIRASTNVETMISGVDVKRKWSIHDMNKITARTINQSILMDAFQEGYNIAALGCPGTGKTFLAMYLAMKDVLNPSSPRDHIIIVRSVVPSREVGHLPGTLEEKQAVYEQPYRDILSDLFGRSSTYDDMKAAGIIRFMTTSFVRGLSWDNAVVIIDEAQNLVQHEMNSVQTRVGQDTRVVVCGDTAQNDLSMSRSKELTGLPWAIRVMNRMPSYRSVTFTVDDIQRSDYVAEWIRSVEYVDSGTEETFNRQRLNG